MAQDNLKNTMIVVDAMKSTSQVLKQQYGKIDVSKIEVTQISCLKYATHIVKTMQDEMEDLLEQANEVQEIMSRSYGVPQDIDEDELQAGNFFRIH